MELVEIKGNLFDENTFAGDVYVHCISADFAMGKGIALDFCRKYPVFKYQKTALRDYYSKNPNGLFLVRIDDILIANLVTKEKYFNKPTYASLEKSLRACRDVLSEQGLPVKRLIMPKIGCGLDRLDWSCVKPLIEDVFSDTDYKILVFYL